MGIETLTEQERDQVKKFFSASLLYPPEFEKWIVDRVLMNIGNMPIGQLQGGRGTRFIDSNTSTVSVTATGETTLYSFPLKDKTIGQNGELRVVLFGRARTSDATNTVTVRLKLGGTTLASFQLAQDVLDGTLRPLGIEYSVVNAGSYAAQFIVGRGTFQDETGTAGPIQAVGSSSVDTGAAQTLAITAQWSSSGNMEFEKRFVTVQTLTPIGV